MDQQETPSAVNTAPGESPTPHKLVTDRQAQALRIGFRGHWARDLMISVVLAIFVILFIYQPVKVEGTSMTPTLDDQERIFINKFVYRFPLWEYRPGRHGGLLVSGRPHQVLHQARDRDAWRPCGSG